MTHYSYQRLAILSRLAGLAQQDKLSAAEAAHVHRGSRIPESAAFALFGVPSRVLGGRSDELVLERHETGRALIYNWVSGLLPCRQSIPILSIRRSTSRMLNAA